jgi:hypothetical protein
MARGNDYKKKGALDLLEIKSSCVFHITQSKSQTPTPILTLSFIVILFTQFPNKFMILVAGDRLNVMCTIRHIFGLQKRVVINKCWIASSL